MKSKSVSVNVTANGLAANNAQKTANQAVEKLNHESSARTAYQIANDETLSELNQAQSDFESNLAWTKSQIEINSHQNDSAVNSLKSDMETAWNSMTSTENSLYNSASTATSEVDKRLGQSLSDLRSTADSLHTRADILYSNANSTRDSLTTATSELEKALDSTRGSMSVVDVNLRNEITSTKSDLASKASSLASATSEVQDDLTKTRTSLASQAASLATASSELGSGMDQAYTSLHAVNDSLRAATSEIKQQTGKISGSLSTADSMIMFNSNAIAEVKRTANLIEADLTDTKGNVASIQAQADSLQSQITDSKNNISSVKQTADGLEQTVKHGSRNLIETAMELSLENGDERVGDHVVGLVNSLHEENTQASLSVLPPELNGQKLTVSFDVLTNDASQLGKMYVNVGLFDIQGNKKAELTNVPFANIIANQWTRFSTTFDIPQDWTSAGIVGHTSKKIDDHTGEQITATLGAFYYSVQFKNASPVPYKIKCAQAEFGPNATAFVAPDSSISKLIQTSKELKSLISDNDGDISQLRQTAKELQSQITDSNGNISGLQQTAGEIKQNVKDNQNNISSVSQKADSINASLTNTRGDVTNLQATAKGLTSRVSDAEGNISNLQQTASGLSNDVKDAKGNISSLQQTAKSYGTRIADAEGNVSTLKQTASDLQSSIADNKNNISSVKLKADSLQTQLSNANGDISNLKQTATTLQSQVTDNKNNVSLVKQTATQLSSDMKDAKGNISSLQQTAAGLSSTVRSGSRNLIKTAMELKLENEDETVNDYVVGLVNPGYGNWHEDDTQAPLSVSVPELNGQKLTVGFDLLVNDTAQLGGMYVNLGLFNGQGTRISELTNASFAGRGAVAKQWTRINTAFDVPKDWTSSKITTHSGMGISNHTGETISATLGALYYGIQFKNTSSVGYKIKRAQAEIGPNATAFVAPDFSISKLIQTSKELSSQIVDSDGNISQLRQTAKSLQAQVADNKGNISNVEQTADGLTSTVRNQANTVSQLQHKADMLQSQIADANGNVSELTQTANGLQSQVTDANENISNLQQTAKQLNSDMKDAKGNISSLQQTAGQFSTSLKDANKNVSSLQQTAKELDAQIKSVDGKATTIKATADGVSARVSKIEGNKVVGSLLKLDGNEAGLGTYVNNKLIAGINTNPDGVCIEGKNIHLNGQTHIDDGVINASKITVHNSVGNADGSATDQLLAVAWGQLNSTIGKTTDNGKTSLWGSINQTADKFSSYYTKSDIDNTLSQQSSLISQTADNITAIVNDVKTFSTYTVSSSNTWDFDYTKSTYGNWFLNGETSGNYVYNGPRDTNKNPLTPFMYVTSRGPKDGSRFVVTVWKDNDPTQYQRIWNGGSWSEWVMLPNSQNLISAINLSPDSVKISGKNIELNGNTKVTGRLDLMQDQNNWVNQSTNYHNPWSWNNAHIYFDNYLQLLGENCDVVYTDTTHLNGGSRFYSITTLTPGYLKFTTYQNKVSTTDENFDGQIARTYIDSSRIETNDVWAGDLRIVGHHIRPTNGNFVMISNSGGTNFDGNGSVGFQLYGGVGLGKNTIYCRSGDLYVQIGNAVQNLDQSYDSAGKVNIHCGKVTSQWANTVSSRLSVKTAITKVTYDRALMAVQNTDMYDYRYTTDDTGQHYVSGIIDDIHDKPEYNMDPMLINQERTARIDANLLGYHHVVLQEILKRLDKLEAK